MAVASFPSVGSTEERREQYTERREWDRLTYDGPASAQLDLVSMDHQYRDRPGVLAAWPEARFKVHPIIKQQSTTHNKAYEHRPIHCWLQPSVPCHGHSFLSIGRHMTSSTYFPAWLATSPLTLCSWGSPFPLGCPLQTSSMLSKTRSQT